MNLQNIFNKSLSGKDKLVLLEGLHAVKHAYRFGAEFEKLISPDKGELLSLASKLAPDIVDFLDKRTEEVSAEEYTRIFPHNLHGRIAALARRAKKSDELSGVAVWIENPNSINNFGAVIRVLAARGVKSLLVSGAEFSAWHKDALRTGAGLHFALDNIFDFKDAKEALGFLSERDYKIAALDPTGQVPQRKHKLNEKICFTFGTERDGLSDLLKKHSNLIYKIPMQEKVSSLNLATSVAAFLYGWVE